jgi:hypothetical protein
VLICAAIEAWCARHRNRRELDAKETGFTYALVGAIIGAVFALAVLFLAWIVG